MKNIFIFAFVIGAATLLSVAASNAQSVGVQTVFSDLPIAPNATNSYAPFAYCPYGNLNVGSSEFETLGFALSSTGGTNGTITVRLAKSPDGSRAEAVPSVVLTCTPNGTNDNTAFYTVAVTGVRTLFVASIEATGGQTNRVTLIVNRQAPKRGVFAATPF